MLIWAAFIGFFFFGELPDLYTWIGGAMIFISTTYIAVRSHGYEKAGNAKTRHVVRLTRSVIPRISCRRFSFSATGTGPEDGSRSHPRLRALISVSDKTGRDPARKGACSAWVVILSTGGTAKALAEAGVPVQEVSDRHRLPGDHGREMERCPRDPWRASGPA